jgi:hypothetical protein
VTARKWGLLDAYFGFELAAAAGQRLQNLADADQKRVHDRPRTLAISNRPEAVPYDCCFGSLVLHWHCFACSLRSRQQPWEHSSAPLPLFP